MKRVLAVVGLAACLAATPPPLPRLWDGPTIFAAQTHIRRLNVPYLRRIANAGFDAVRIPLVPWWAQNRDGSWDFSNYDGMYRWLTARNMIPLFVLQNPRDEKDVALVEDFARKAAPRYPKALLELGNEPDNPEQWPAFYPPHVRSRLTATAYWTIARQFARAWREGAVQARIATAGTSGIDVPWQRELVRAIEADGAFTDGTISAIGVHAYGEQAPRKHARHNDIIADMQALKALLPDGVTAWVTEYGIIDPRPEDVREWFATMAALGVPVFSWYESQDDQMNGEVYRYGLVDVAGSPKPAYDAARSFLENRTSRPTLSP